MVMNSQMAAKAAAARSVTAHDRLFADPRFPKLMGKYHGTADWSVSSDDLSVSFHLAIPRKCNHNWTVGFAHPPTPGNTYDVERALELIEHLADEVTAPNFTSGVDRNVDKLTSALHTLFSGESQSKL